MILKFRKFIVLISSILIMLCLGGIYGFSIFVPPLKSEYGLSSAETQTIFGFTIVFFALFLVIAGRLLIKTGPKLSAIIGALLFSSGYLLASFSSGNFILLVIGIGILAGSGIGFGYVCSLTTPIRWFPKLKGLITGLSVSGFGGGAILLSQLVRYFLTKEISILNIFRVIGIAYGLCVFLSALLISIPKENKKGTSSKGMESSHIGFSVILKDKRFWLLFITMFSGTFAGLIIIGNLKPIGLFYNISEFYATIAISFFAVGNSLGRIIWGRITDIIGGKKTITISLFSLSIFTLLVLTSENNNILFVLMSLLVGLGFSANFVLFAAEVSGIYGTQNLGGVYPSVHLSYGISGIIGPIIGGLLYDFTNTYIFSIIIGAIVSITGGVIFYCLYGNIKIGFNKK